MLESAGCRVSIKLAEEMDRTTVGVSIFRRRFRMVGSPIKSGLPTMLERVNLSRVKGSSTQAK